MEGKFVSGIVLETRPIRPSAFHFYILMVLSCIPAWVWVRSGRYEVTTLIQLFIPVCLC